MNDFDLNCDIEDTEQEALMPYLTSVNIACGGHAGDDEMMRMVVAQAQRHHLMIGAHPSYPDRPNFGRIAMIMPLAALSATVYEQITALARVAGELNADIRHVKPHGALYNSAVASRELAQAIAEGVGKWSTAVTLVGLANSPMLAVFAAAGFAVLPEAFADRRYEPDGSLRARRHPDAVITSSAEAVNQVREIRSGYVTAVDGTRIPLTAGTVCVHGDNPNALAIVKEIAMLSML